MTTGTDIYRGLYLNLTNANHTGGTTNLYGIDFTVTDSDNAATSNVYALNVGSGFDAALNLASPLLTSAVVNSTVTNAAGGSANPLDVTATLGIMDGSDTYEALDINLTNANHTGASNVVTGIDLGAITGDAEATETALKVGTGWDILLDTGATTLTAAELDVLDAEVTLGTETAGNFVGSASDGTGIDGICASENCALALSTDSTEAGFLAAGALTCGASTAGKVQIHTTPLQYCDNAATPALQYAAYGDSAGASTAAANDSVAMATDTTGNFVATVTGTASEIEVSGSGLENAAVTVGMPNDVIIAAAGSLALPQGAAPTVDAAGEIAVDTTGPQLIYFDGTAARVAAELLTKTMVIETPAAADDFLFFRAERAITVTGIDCVVAAVTSAVVTVNECDANGGTCVAVEAAMTCGTTNTTEATGIDNAVIDAGDWVRVDVGTVSGTPGHVAVTVSYRENQL